MVSGCDLAQSNCYPFFSLNMANINTSATTLQLGISDSIMYLNGSFYLKRHQYILILLNFQPEKQRLTPILAARHIVTFNDTKP